MEESARHADESGRPFETGPDGGAGVERSRGDTLSVAQMWADQILAVATFHKRRTVTVGLDAHCDFVIDGHGLGPHLRFPLVEWREGTYMLHFTRAMTGTVKIGEQHYSLRDTIDAGIARPSAELPDVFEAALGWHTSARIELGTATFLIRFTDMPEVAGPGFRVDTEPLPYLGLSAAAHLAVLLLALTVPGDAHSLQLDATEADDRFAQMIFEPEQQVPDEPKWLDDDQGSQDAAAHRGEEGKAGEEDAAPRDNEMAVEGPPDNTAPQLAMRHDVRVAETTGVEAVFNDNELASMWESGTDSVGDDIDDAIANLDGTDIGPAQGAGGLGIRNTGRGGPGSDTGFGVNIDTSGPGNGGGDGGPGSPPRPDLGPNDEKLPTVVPEPPDVEGSLDEEIIRRVIRRNRRQIAYCYEKELQKDKTLRGRIKVKFTILPSGEVVSALTLESTMNNRAVESCINAKVRRWVFPAPDGNGMVVVKYPFNFSRQ